MRYKYEYKIKKRRDGNMKKMKCPVCFEEHEVDSSGWVQMCLGYYPAFIMRLDPADVEEYIKTWRLK